MDNALPYLWAKTTETGGPTWHPLALHMLDVAASSDAILAREPETTRLGMAAILDMTWDEARPWLLLVIACHDLGKASPGFQCKWRNMTGLATRRSPDTGINHAFVSQITLAEWLRERGWPDDLAERVADAAGCHHGERAKPSALDSLMGNERGIGGNKWTRARRDLVEAMAAVFAPAAPPVRKTLDGPGFMLLSGLTSFADWIGSNEEWFPYGTPEDCTDLPGWFRQRRDRAARALDAIGWAPRTPLSPEARTFEQVFDFSPRPLQQAVAEAVAGLNEPAVLLVEAPMGEGKTEAAFFAHLELQRRFGHRGLYVALPTQATGNAMFTRTLKFLRDQGTNRTLDLQLLHGAAALNEPFRDLRLSGIHDPAAGGAVRSGEWFTRKKRALLSEYGVGTVDQALLPILPVRHHFVRLWGLANRVVVFDEIHAYDAYTGTLLDHLLRWLLALGSSVVLLSATLPPSARRKLAAAVNADPPEREAPYPRLSVFRPGAVEQVHFEADPKRRLTLRLEPMPPDLPHIRSALEEHLADGGMGLALVNTVQRAQDLYRLFPDGEPLERNGQRVGKRLPDGTEVYLFHARFPADRRQQREERVLETFGEGDNHRTGRKILIATQVAEQSLDLDFDLIVTDLAPIDLVLQRAGRLWRHPRGPRPVSKPPTLLVAGLAGDAPPAFGEPLWWGAVYREDILLRTWSLLREQPQLTLPDEIDPLVRAVYEEERVVPEALRERLEGAQMEGEGEAMACRSQAHQAIVGLPDDASWDDPARFVLFDEDAPGVHRTLMARTRLGDDGVVAIPLWPEDGFAPEGVPDFATAARWFRRAVRLSRKGVVGKLQAQGVPAGWQKSPLLRNCLPLPLDAEGCWSEDATVRLDDDLGVTYEPKEPQWADST
ncbi:MAG: CRISPR-associated helicase Cas3' [Leptospirillia bacterium]